MSADVASLARLAAALADEVMTPGVGRCDLTADVSEARDQYEENPADRGRCTRPVAALRWEDGFLDRVCAPHAVSASGRGATIVHPKHHDGTEH